MVLVSLFGLRCASCLWWCRCAFVRVWGGRDVGSDGRLAPPPPFPVISCYVGTVQGVFNSVAGVGGAVTDTVSKLTFDNEYQMKRERTKNKAMADQGGVGQGLMQVGGIRTFSRVLRSIQSRLISLTCGTCWVRPRRRV